MAIEWLKKLRMEKYASQAALALAAGITPSRYSRLENGYSELREEEVRGLAKALKLTLAEVRSGQPGAAKPKAATPPRGLNAAKAAEAPPPHAPPVTPPPSAPTPPPAPVETKPGDNLEDPKNFSLMPPVHLLSHGDTNDSGLRSQLQAAAVFAEKVLHTSRVRPAVWVAWRDFSRDAQNFMRSPAPAAAPIKPKLTPKPQAPAPKPPPARPAPVKAPAKDASARPHGNKNVFGHFADVAKEWLPEATRATLTEKALAAKTSNPEMGFMKHFKRIAEIELPREEFDRIDREAKRRDNTGT